MSARQDLATRYFKTLYKLVLIADCVNTDNFNFSHALEDGLLEKDYLGYYPKKVKNENFFT